MLRRVAIGAMLVLGLLLVLSGGLSSLVMARHDPAEGVPLAEASAAEMRVEAALAQLPLYFIENRRQADERVAYYVQGKDKTLYFTPQGVTFVLNGPGSLESAGTTESFGHPQDALSRWVVKLDFLGANSEVQLVGRDETGAVISYFKGRPEEWKTGLKTYAAVVYPDLWPGIDLEYSGTVNRLKYQFVIQPGADPRQIRLAYRGADVAIGEAGHLEVSAPVGGFRDDAPYAYQEAEGGQRVEVEVAYTLQGDLDEEGHAYGFHVGAYDPSRRLVLDPATLVYCGYIGGASGDTGSGIAVDGHGNAYVVGHAWSSEASFPATVGPGLTNNGGADAFVAKVGVDGTALVYCGYIGGSEADYATSVAVDGDGSAYITGSTASSHVQGFPVITGPDLGHNGGWDAFVAKVNASGTALVYCGYIGGSDRENSEGIAIDSLGNAYLAGDTWSSETSFPVAVGPDLTHNGHSDAFVAKVNASGSALAYCGYVGGSAEDAGYGVAVDDGGHAYLAGETESSEGTFPVIVGPDLTYNGAVYHGDAFVAKVNAGGTALDYCGYIGGSADDQVWGIAVDDKGQAYVTGETTSGQASFPVKLGPDLTYNGTWPSREAFVAKVNASGATLDYCGYIGGSDEDLGAGIAVDELGNAYVTGDTWSSAPEGFPVLLGPDLSYNGNWDAFVAKVDASGTGLVYCGYIGGSEDDTSSEIAVDGYGDAYVTGNTRSDEASFPATVGPDLTYNGSDHHWYGDAFVAKIETNHRPALGSAIPTTGGGLTGFTTYFTTTWSDPDGWQDLKQCYFHIGAGPSLANNVTLLYNAQADKLWIRSDDGTAWLGGFAPGSGYTLENSQARVYCGLTTRLGVGDTLQVRWAIEFRAGYTGAKKTGLMCKDVHKAKAEAEWIGTWTIGTVATITLQEGWEGYTGCSDTRMSAEEPDANFGSDDLKAGARQHIASLIQFDLSSIPANALVESAQLQIYAHAREGTGTFELGAYVVRQSWLEDGATWNVASPSDPWGSPGCNDIVTDRAEDPTGVVTVGAVGWYTWSVRDDVQDMVSRPETNRGWLLRQTAQVAGVLSVLSSEHGAVSNRPKLVITYRGPDGPAAPWPMFRHDPQHTGRSPFVGPSNAGLKWRYEIGSPVRSSPAIDYDGTIYIGAGDGCLYAINPDGTLKWRYQTGDVVESSPAIGHGGVIYVGSRDSSLYAINADGTLRWRYETGGMVRSSPAIGDYGTIYVGSDEGYLYAINRDGTIKWRRSTVTLPPYPELYSSPALAANGTVYVTTGRDAYLYAITPDGSLQWSVFLSSKWSNMSPAVAADGTIYAGTDAGHLNAHRPDGAYEWISELPYLAYPTSPAIDSDGTIYLGTDASSSGELYTRSSLYAIHPNGSHKWRFEVGAPVQSSPAIGADGIIYVGANDDYLYAISPDGTLKWSYPTGGDVYSSPAIGADGTIYFGSNDGYLYALTEAVETTITLQQGIDGFSGCTDTRISEEAPNANFGSEDLKAGAGQRIASLVQFDLSGIPTDATIDSAWLQVYAHSREGTATHDLGVHPVKRSWIEDQATWNMATSSDPWGAPGCNDIVTDRTEDPTDVVAVGTPGWYAWWVRDDVQTMVSQPETNQGWLLRQTAAVPGFLSMFSSEHSGIAYRPKLIVTYWSPTGMVAPWPMFRHDVQHTARSPYTGAAAPHLMWRYGTSAAIRSSPAIAGDGTVYVGSDDDHVYAINPDGTLEWRYQTGDDIVSSPAIWIRDMVYVGSNDGYLYGITKAGTLGWRFPTRGAVSSSPAIGLDGTTIYVASLDGDVYLIPPDYERWWWGDCPVSSTASSPAIGSDGTVYIGSKDGHLYAITRRGDLEWRDFLGGQLDSSPAVGADGTIYIGSADGHLHARHPDGTMWHFLTGDAVTSSPAIGADGTVYVGSWDSYLYALYPDGTLRWRYATGGQVHSSPAIGADDCIYVGSNDGYLYAINSDGTLKWRYATGGPVTSSPAIGAGGTIYFGSGDGYLYALND